MKQIYFVLTYTGTILSRIVRIFMKDEYGHVSLSLDKDLTQMYSFGRLNPYNTFRGGFVHEHVHGGTFKRFKKTSAKVVCLEVNDEQYNKLVKNIKEFEEKKDDFKFNTLGLFAVYFKKRIEREKRFYCAEFVKYIIEEADINLNLPEIIRPQDFNYINQSTQIYKGLLREYC